MCCSGNCRDVKIKVKFLPTGNLKSNRGFLEYPERNMCLLQMSSSYCWALDKWFCFLYGRTAGM